MDVLRLGLAPFLLFSALAAAACSSSSTNVTQDGGTDSGTDAKQPDVAPKDVVLEPLQPFDGHFAGPDASPGTGTLFQTGYGLILDGVTSDGQVIYSNAGEVPTFFAAPLAGGPVVNLGLAGGYAYAIIQGTVAFIFTNLDLDDSSYASPLMIWTQKNGVQMLTENSYLDTAAVSNDNSYILYIDNYSEEFQTGDLYVAGTDGKGRTLLAMGLQNLSPGGTCVPNFTFSGTTAILATCASASPSNVTLNTYQPPPGADAGTVDAGSWTNTNTVTGVTSLGFAVEPTATYVAFTTSTGLEVAPLAGGIPTVIDPTGVHGAFTSDGMNIVYTTSTNTLASSPVAVPLPNVLVTAGVTGIFGLSPDNSSALLWNLGGTSSPLTDLSTASATAAGALTTYVPTAAALIPGDGYFGGDAYSADSSHVLFFTNAMQTSEDQTFGALNVAAVGTVTATQLSADSTTVWAASGTKVVYADNVLFGATTTLDIDAVDVASGTPTLISHLATSGATAAFFLTPAKDKIIYSWTQPGTENGGIYLAPVP
jgi:hypothetical protein